MVYIYSVYYVPRYLPRYIFSICRCVVPFKFTITTTILQQYIAAAALQAIDFRLRSFLLVK